MSYWWAMTLWLRHLQILGPDEVLDMVLFNFLRKAMPDVREQDDDGMYLNKNGTVSKRQPPPFFKRQEMIFTDDQLQVINRRIRAEAWEMQRVREGKLPVTKNPTEDCGWDCDFVDVCEVHEMGGDHQSILDLEFSSYDPYEPYREVVEQWR